MPYGKCPVCSQLTHFSVGLTSEEWYRRFSLKGLPDGPAELLCLNCWRGIRDGSVDLDALKLAPDLRKHLRKQLSGDAPFDGGK